MSRDNSRQGDGDEAEVEVPKNKGYVYMNVLGPYYDDAIKISDGYVVLKVGKASSTTLNTRMQTEYNAATALGLKANWPRSATSDDTGLKAYNVYLQSFDPAKALDALPYYMVPSNKNLDATETAVRDLWEGSVLGDPKSLAWLARRSGRSPEGCRGDAGKLGAITETLVVPWSVITHVRKAGRDAGPDAWKMKALSDAIGAAKGAGGPLTAMKAEWTAVNDQQLSLLPLVQGQVRAYTEEILSCNGLSSDQAELIAALIKKQQDEFLIFLANLKK